MSGIMTMTRYAPEFAPFILSVILVRPLQRTSALTRRGLQPQRQSRGPYRGRGHFLVALAAHPLALSDLEDGNRRALGIWLSCWQSPLWRHIPGETPPVPCSDTAPAEPQRDTETSHRNQPFAISFLRNTAPSNHPARRC